MMDGKATISARDTILEVIGIHAIALEIAAKMLAQDRGGPVEEWVNLLLIAGHDNYQKMHPAEFRKKLDIIIAAVKGLKDDEHDPVVLFDPVTGPVRDSELQAIVEQAREAQPIKWDGTWGTVREEAAVRSHGDRYDADGERVGQQCPSCSGTNTRHDPGFKTWKCEDCSTLWGES